MKVEGLLNSLRTSMYGLTAQTRRLEAISENIANAENVSSDGVTVYRKKKVVETPGSGRGGRGFQEAMTLKLRKTNRNHLPISARREIGNAKPAGKVEIVEIDGERLVFDPTHPRANEEGFLKLPDINVVEEMVDLISATRAYEANVSVISATKLMSRKALEI